MPDSSSNLNSRLHSSTGLGNRPFPTNPDGKKGAPPASSRSTKLSSIKNNDISESLPANCIRSSSARSGNKRQSSRTEVGQTSVSNADDARESSFTSFTTSSAQSMNPVKSLSAKSDDIRLSTSKSSGRSASQPKDHYRASTEISNLQRNSPLIQSTVSRDTQLTTPSRTNAQHTT